MTTKKTTWNPNKTPSEQPSGKRGKLAGLKPSKPPAKATPSPSKPSRPSGALAGLSSKGHARSTTSPKPSTLVTSPDTSSTGTRLRRPMGQPQPSSTATKPASSPSPGERSRTRTTSSGSSPTPSLRSPSASRGAASSTAAAKSSPTRLTTRSTAPSSPGRSDQRVIRQPWATKTTSWAAHVNRAKRVRTQFPPGRFATVSWRWDAGSAFSTRPDAIDDSFGGTIERYDELGQMHLVNERGIEFVIPCGYITGIK